MIIPSEVSWRGEGYYVENPKIPLPSNDPTLNITDDTTQCSLIEQTYFKYPTGNRTNTRKNYYYCWPENKVRFLGCLISEILSNVKEIEFV